MNDNSISKELVDAFNAAMNGRGSPSRNTKQRLIDANQAMRKIREYMEDYPNATTRLAACRACLSILGDENQVPTIDPFKYAYWDANEICSACGVKSTEGLDAEKWNYWLPEFCPNCGAKMEGGHNP